MSRGLLEELRRRNVIRMAGLYLVGAWLLVQIASTLFPAFGVPGWALRALVIVLALGFVPALVFTWVYELTPDGLKRDAEVPPEYSIAPQTARRMDRIIIAVLGLALVYFAFDKFVLSPRRAQAQVATTAAIVPATAVAAPVANDMSIAVLPFADMSQGKDQEYFSDGLSEELWRDAAIARALATADKAITLAPDLPDGYSLRGTIRHRLSWDWQGAQADFARAIALDPNNARTLLNYGPTLFTIGRRVDGLAALRKAVASDPLSDSAWSTLARHLQASGATAEAKQAFERALTINPRQNWANFLLGNLLLSEGQTEQAIPHYQVAPEQFRTTGMAMAEFTRGNEAASKALLAKMEKDYAIGFAYQIAQAYAWRGEKDQAFAWLERCFPIHDAGLVRLPFDPAMDPLRGDPRFAALVQRMGFPK